MNLIDLAHELALIENITRQDLALAATAPARNDLQTGFDRHTYYIAEVLGLATYDHRSEVQA